MINLSVINEAHIVYKLTTTPRDHPSIYFYLKPIQIVRFHVNKLRDTSGI